MTPTTTILTSSQPRSRRHQPWRIGLHGRIILDAGQPEQAILGPRIAGPPGRYIVGRESGRSQLLKPTVDKAGRGRLDSLVVATLQPNAANHGFCG
jgi:hypothetical protein